MKRSTGRVVLHFGGNAVIAQTLRDVLLPGTHEGIAGRAPNGMKDVAGTEQHLFGIAKPRGLVESEILGPMQGFQTALPTHTGGGKTLVRLHQPHRRLHVPQCPRPLFQLRFHHAGERAPPGQNAPPLRQFGEHEIGGIEAVPERVLELNEQALAARDQTGVQQSGRRLMIQSGAVFQQAVRIPHFQAALADADVHDLREHIAHHAVNAGIGIAQGNERQVNVGVGTEFAASIPAGGDKGKGRGSGVYASADAGKGQQTREKCIGQVAERAAEAQAQIRIIRDLPCQNVFRLVAQEGEQFAALALQIRGQFGRGIQLGEGSAVGVERFRGGKGERRPRPIVIMSRWLQKRSFVVLMVQ